MNSPSDSAAGNTGIVRLQLASLTKNRFDLKGLSTSELADLVDDLNLPGYRAKQIERWMNKGGVSSFSEMTNIPISVREKLEEVSFLGTLRTVTTAESTDGTVKFLLALPSERMIETVIIPDIDEDGIANRVTVCVSSQVGCALGCTFCATGMMGFRENLNSGQIFDQVFFANEESKKRFGRPLSNIVFMGMGEPLMNYDAVLGSVVKITSDYGLGMGNKRITISTVGLASRIKSLADDGIKCNLAISLHAPTQAQRSSIMPVNRKRKTDLSALEEAVKYYHSQTHLPVTYEYCMFDGFNDSEKDAAALADIVEWAPSKVNLIMFNPVENSEFSRTDENRLNKFIRVLVKRKVRVTVRRSRGQDIDAACGQLATKQSV